MPHRSLFSLALRPTIALCTWLMISMCGTHVAATPLDSNAHSLLWKLTAPNGAVSHIYGTMHLRDSSIMRQRDTVLALVKQARIFYAELDLDSMMSAMSGLDPSVAMLTGGQTLATLYTPEDLAIIRAALRVKLGEMGGMVETMRPPIIVAMLMMEMTETTAPYGIDEFLWEVAKQSNIKRAGIESPQEQIGALMTMPNEELVDVARSINDKDTLTPILIAAYANERLPEIAALSSDLSKWPEFERSVNGGRNVIMIERLAKELIRGDIFIAVGALHLPGPQGMLRGLELRGFAVEPVLGGLRNSWMPPPTPRTGTPPPRH